MRDRGWPARPTVTRATRRDRSQGRGRSGRRSRQRGARPRRTGGLARSGRRRGQPSGMKGVVHARRVAASDWRAKASTRGCWKPQHPDERQQKRHDEQEQRRRSGPAPSSRVRESTSGSQIGTVCGGAHDKRSDEPDRTPRLTPPTAGTSLAYRAHAFPGRAGAHRRHEGGIDRDDDVGIPGQHLLRGDGGEMAASGPSAYRWGREVSVRRSILTDTSPARTSR